MADIHVLAGDGVGSWTLVFHIAVPDENNRVGVSYRTALVSSGVGGGTTMTEGTDPGEIAPAEAALIVAGEVYEASLSLPMESGATNNPEMLASARSAYAKLGNPILSRLRKRLRYYGYTAAKE